MKNDNEIDQLFKKGLSEPDIPFDESHWQQMEKMLGPEQPKRVLPLWMVTACGIAAALLIVMFLTLNKDQANQPVKSLDQLHTGLVKPNPAKEVFQNSPNFKEPVQNSSSKPAQKLEKAIALTPLITVSSDVADVKESLEQINTQPLALAENKAEVSPETTPPAAPISNTSNLPKNGKSRFSLSIIAAPDISSSQDHLNAKVSTNVGLLATYSITQKLSITTGAVYARKLYDYAGISASNYGSAGKAWEVDANCKVLDIPLNLNYRVYSKGSNSITINSGISSYFMLNEKYKYINSDGAGGTKISNLEIVNKNQHLLGVANISASFNRQISSKLNIGIQPFIKIPLTGLGYHDSKLRSTGIAVSLNLNIPKSSERK